MPQRGKDAIITVFHRNIGRTECSNYRGISLVAHASKILLNIIARCLSYHCKRVGILLEEQSCFRPNRSTNGTMLLVSRRLQEFARKKRIPFYACYIDLTKAYDPVDQTLPWTILARFGVANNMILVIRQFHDGMRACVRLDDRVFSRLFAVEWGLCQRSILALLLFDIFFEPVINVAYTRFKTNNKMGVLVHLRKETEAEGREEATAGEPVLVKPLWGMLYADDARVIL